ncbi:phosphotransferase [Pseudohalioglobus sediminis]|uniref:Phosphotransferase n=1 Tax=Pseudohalioglobus sediminis TaxID=2606449 RepID=A0A5B0X1H6_9GAMM|nr:phosphotransferase [Pseudohalioglobus sediminis]
MVDIVTKPAEITAEWFTRALHESGRLPEGRVTDVDYTIIGTGKMGDNARFQLCYEGLETEAPASVIVKFPAADETARMMAGAQGAYFNEVMFYRHLADKTSIRTPEIFANEISEDRMDFIIVMEDMAPAEPGSQLVGETLARTQVALKQAARLASAFYDDDSLKACDFVVKSTEPEGAKVGQDFLQQFWPTFLQRFGDSLDASAKQFGEHYVNNHVRFACHYAGPKTLVHGDFRSENILFDGDMACTVDWQTISEHSPLTDLAYFMGGSVDTAQRRQWERDVVAEYRDELARLGVKLSLDDCWNQYRLQSMHGLMITILGACFAAAGERSDRMFLTMAQRHFQHCLDLDAMDFLG